MKQTWKAAAVVLLVLAGLGSAQTVDWITGLFTVPPAAWSISPANPSPGDLISFEGPTDQSYGNSCTAEGQFGGVPIITINNFTKTIELQFQGPVPIFCPAILNPAVGLEGNFGPLAAGNWTFKCTHIKIPFQINFTVGGGGGGNIIRVDENAPFTIVPPDGSSWVMAYHNLQDGLAAAQAGDTIRVADGTYRPDVGGGVTPGDRSASFVIPQDVTVECGYAGYGALLPDTRDIDLYPTILSGDLNSNDLWGILNTGENCYHVVTSHSSGTLDGATIIAGNADGVANDGFGAAILMESSTLVVQNCKIRDNQAEFGGAIACLSGIAPTLLHTQIYGNWASFLGGAIYNDDANLEIINCLIAGNICGAADIIGGDAIFNAMGSLDIHSSTIVDNRPYHGAPANGRAIVNFVWGPGFVDTISVKNSIIRNGGQEIWSTEPGIVTLYYNNIEGGTAGFGGLGNIDQDPQFKNPGVGGIEGGWYFDVDGYTLLPSSPSINAGNQSFLPAGLAVDLLGNPRVQGGQVDQGAYEGFGLVPAVVLVPHVVGFPQATAQSMILSANLSVGTVTQAYSNTVPNGNVISQNPAGGSTANVGSAVNLVVSKGPAPGPGPAWQLLHNVNIFVPVSSSPSSSTPVNGTVSLDIESNFVAEYKIEIAGVPAAGGTWWTNPSTGILPAGNSTLVFDIHGTNVDLTSFPPGNHKVAEAQLYVRPQ